MASSGWGAVRHDAPEHQPSLQQVCHAALNAQPAHSNSGPQRNRGIGECLFFFGICTDVQWAEIPDMDVHPNGTRHYKQALNVLQRATQSWNEHKVPFTIHLGDIIDMRQKSFAGRGTLQERYDYALDKAICTFNQYTGKTFHVVGNHCVHCFPRAQLIDELKIPTVHGDRAYYSFTPHPKWLCVVLDTFDVSVCCHDKNSAQYRESKNILMAQQEASGNLATADRTLDESHIDMRWAPWNGGLGQVQLAWLRGVLADAKRAQQKVLVFAHCPFHPTVVRTRTASLLWNFPQVLQILQQSGNVVATFTGHVHQQSAHVDSAGIYHYTLPAILETPKTENQCHGIVYVGSEGLVMEGAGAFRTEPVARFDAASVMQNDRLQRHVLTQKQVEVEGAEERSDESETSAM